MFRKQQKQKKFKESSCPAYAIGCDNCSPISILKPEIVIEERRWLPYPLIIRHYIPKPQCKKQNCFQQIYCKCKEEFKEWEERRKNKRRAREAAERIERERCLKELRRLHSYHQQLCCNTQSFSSFGKHVKKTKRRTRSRFGLSSHSHDSKKKCKTRKKSKDSQPQFLCIRIIGNVCCVISLLAVIGFALFILL